MKKIRSYVLIPLMTVLLIGLSTAFTANASAEETSTSSVTLNTVTLAQHSSYVSDKYFGVINVGVADTGIAAASSDSEGHVIVTAVGSGTTRVLYWYRSDALSGWTRATLPVTVSGTAAVDSTATGGTVITGLVLPQTSVSLKIGGDYTASGVTLNGSSVNTTSLLWVSSSNPVATVDSATGKITAAGAGTAVIYALDPTTKSVAGINVSVD
jgi:hypothetical protein